MSILIYKVDDEIKFDLNWQGWGFVFTIFFLTCLQAGQEFYF